MFLGKWSTNGLSLLAAAGGYHPVLQPDVEAQKGSLLRLLASDRDQQRADELEEKRRLSVVLELDESEDSSSDGGDFRTLALNEEDPATMTLRGQSSRRAVLLRNGCYVAMNVASTTAITFLNRAVVDDPQLRNCQVSFATYHFLTTFLVLYVSTFAPFRLFPRVRLPLLKILPLCALFAGFLVLANLSLAFNSIEFYILARMMTCPCVVLLQWLLLRKKCSAATIAGVALLTVGVIVANGKFGWAHPLGAAIAVAGFTVTAAYQVWIQKRLEDLECTPLQLLLNQAPVTVVLLLAVVPLFDSKPDFSQVPSPVWVALFASGFVASLINISQFLIIGATSALTFNVIGIVKILAVLIIGWSIEHTLPTAMDIFGIVLALAGTWLYAASTARKPAAPTPTHAPALSGPELEGGLDASEKAAVIGERFSEDSVDQLDAVREAEVQVREVPPSPVGEDDDVTPLEKSNDAHQALSLGRARPALILDAPGARGALFESVAAAAARVGGLFRSRYTAL